MCMAGAGKFFYFLHQTQPDPCQCPVPSIHILVRPGAYPRAFAGNSTTTRWHHAEVACIIYHHADGASGASGAGYTYEESPGRFCQVGIILLIFSRAHARWR